VFVGSHNQEVDSTSNRGAVYVYGKPAGGWSGTLTEIGRLEPADPARSFGYSVAAYGNTVVVGALGNSGPPLIPPAVFVFVRPPGGWVGTTMSAATLTSGSIGIADEFGAAVALSGDTAVVGAPSFDVTEGAVFVYQRPVGGWSGTLGGDAALVASDAQTSDLLGSAVAVRGTTVAAGAPNNGARTGAVYVFERPMGGWSGSLVESARLTASSAQTANFLGRSVAVGQAGVFAGATHELVDMVQEGVVFFFAEPNGGFGGGLNESAVLLSSISGGGVIRLGNALALSGGSVVAGTEQPIGAVGRALVFAVPSGSFAGQVEESYTLMGSDSGYFDLLGDAVAVSGSTVAVGSPQHTVGSNSAQGAVYLYAEIGSLFADAFESADLSAWSDAMP